MISWLNKEWESPEHERQTKLLVGLFVDLVILAAMFVGCAHLCMWGYRTLLRDIGQAAQTAGARP